MSFYFGAHMPSTNIIKSFKEIQKLGGNFMQIFVDNPYGKVNFKLIEKYNKIGPNIRKYMEDNNLKLVIHAPYTLNYAKDVDTKSVKFKIICDELVVAHKLGALGCVIHVGKSLDLSILRATGNMLKSLKYIINFIKENNLDSKLILETAAGQGTEMFVTENNSIINLATFYHMFTDDEKNYIKICIDTCHIHSAGIDLNTRNNVKELFKELQYTQMLEHIIVIHYNNSDTAYNSHVDRHAPIGDGNINISGISEVLKQAYKYNIPCVLETHKDHYTREIPWIKELTKTF